MIAAEDGSVVAAVHAGWRGLTAGVIEKAVQQMACPGERLLAWLGPAIGPDAFEVGPEVREVFTRIDSQSSRAFKPHGEKWLCDIYQLARQRLENLHVTGDFHQWGRRR